MNPIVSIIMGSTSDLPVMEKACKLLDEMQVPFEVNALSAHRTPEAVEEFARKAAKVRSICKASRQVGRMRPSATWLVYLRFAPRRISGRNNSAWYAPQARNVQLAPCQMPETKKMTKVLRMMSSFLRASGCLQSGEISGRLPPNGIYT